MLPQTQTLILLLPLLLTPTLSLPDNIFHKREAFGGPPQITGSPQQHDHSNHPHCAAGGWQACMSSMCAAEQSGAGGPSDVVPPATGVVPGGPEPTGAGAPVCTATDGSCGTGGGVSTGLGGDGMKRKRQEQTGVPEVTGVGGPGPVQTGTPEVTGGFEGKGHGFHMKLGDICAGFSNFMQQSGGALTGMPVATGMPDPAATGVPEASGVLTGTGPVES